MLNANILVAFFVAAVVVAATVGFAVVGTTAGDAVRVFYMTAFVASTFALLPDPLAFHRKWWPEAVPEASDTASRWPCSAACWRGPMWYHLLLTRNFVTHFLCLSFVAHTITLLIWDKMRSQPPGDAEVLQTLLACMAICLVLAVRYHYVTGLVVFVTLSWIMARNHIETADDVMNWTRDTTIALGVLVLAVAMAYWASRWILGHIVDVLQYPASAGFTMAFAMPFFVKGWRAYIVVGPEKDGGAHYSMWGAEVAAFCLTALVFLMQLFYEKRDTWNLGMKPRGGLGRGEDAEEAHGCCFRHRREPAAARPRNRSYAKVGETEMDPEHDPDWDPPHRPAQ